MNRILHFTVACLALLLLTRGETARGAMTLTAGASAAGFTLTTFADGFPFNGSGVGPVGIGFTSGGAVIVSSYAVGKNAVFATDTDGQHYSGASISSSSYSAPSGIASVGGHLYQALQGSGSVIEIDASGNLVMVIVPPGGLPGVTGVTANPTNGHLFVSTPGGGGPAEVYDLNPLTGAHPLFKSVPFDGMTITSDGKTLYGANLGDKSIEGYDTTSGLKVFDSGFIPDGIDGSALGSGTLAGNIFVNTNGGTIVEVNLLTTAQTLIASGGSRGDLVEIDPNGSLLLTQTDRVLRLTGPTGGGFGGTVPEPSTLTMFSLGALSLFFYRWRRRA
jgi:hypothetical protein